MKVPLTRPFDLLSEGMSIVAGWLLIGLSLLVTFEIIARKFFGFSTQGADEIGGYVLAISATFGFSYALVRKAHIRLDHFVQRLSPFGRALFDIGAFFCLNAVIWLLVWRAADVTLRSLELGARAPTPLSTPLIYPQSIWVFGLILFGLVAFVRLGVSVMRLAAGRITEASIELGTSALSEELREELSSVETRRVSGAGAGGQKGPDIL